MEILNFTIPVVIHNSNQRYRIEDYETGIIGTSDCNMFVPFYAAFFSETININNNVILEYSLPKMPSTFRPYRRYTDFFANLVRANNAIKYAFKVDRVDRILGISRGIIYNENGEILLCLAINSNYLMTTPPEEISSNPDYSKFVIFVDDSFNNELYKNVKRKIEQEYIGRARELGIDVIYTSRVKQWIFQNNYVKPKFNSVIELNKHLKEEVPRFVIQ